MNRYPNSHIASIHDPEENVPERSFHAKERSAASVRTTPTANIVTAGLRAAGERMSRITSPRTSRSASGYARVTARPTPLTDGSPT